MSYIRLDVGHEVTVGDKVMHVVDYIDHGGYSNVWLMEHNGNEDYVMKVFRSDEEYDKWAIAEIDILNLIKKEDKDDQFSIIKTVGNCDITDPKTDIVHKAVILPFRNNDLYGYAKEIRPVNMDIIKKITKELIKGFYYLHKNGIIHGDIKLDNILIRECINDDSDDRKIDITDFSLSVRYFDKIGGKTGNDYYYKLIYDNYHLQTVEYKSPEIIVQAPFNTTVDTWALGVMLYKLITGKFPFKYDKLVDFNDNSDSSDDEGSEEEDNESFDSSATDNEEAELEYMQINYILHDIFSKLDHSSDDIKHLKKGRKYYKYFDSDDNLHFGFPKKEEKWSFLREINNVYKNQNVSKEDIDWIKSILKHCLTINLHKRATFKGLYMKYVIEDE